METDADDELLEIAEDLEKLYEDPIYCPDPEPAVPSLYRDCWDPDVNTGYSTADPRATVLSVSRKTYPESEQALRKLNGIGFWKDLVPKLPLYWTATRWWMVAVPSNWKKALYEESIRSRQYQGTRAG